ncbi:MAG TPA: DNA alkylation repair protein [Candidatus Choladousia intestinipullorum]|nr:DNA alkylation repair protein [Candidatus Choladousia intestinipullorum]
MSTISERIREKLFEMQDLQYRDFQAKLVPTVDKETIIGVRTPAVRKFAREIGRDPEIGRFLADLPHQYYDENNLHSFIIERIKDYEECLGEVERFLPYIDNWATCDTQSPKVFAKHTEELLGPIRRWIASDRPYTVRYGIGMLMKFYLDENFKVQYLEMVSSVRSEEYYVKMMAAWYFATALAKQYDDAVRYLQDKKLDAWTHNKTIQKARESYRITAEQKAYLKTLII